jgi:hypothetical protein
MLLTTTLDTAWNDLPLTPIFLPLIHQVLHYLSGAETASSYLVGQTFTGPRDQDGSLPAVDSPSGRRETDAASASGELAVAGREAGNYRLRYKNRHEYVSVNLDTKESNLTRTNVDEFLAAISNRDRGRDSAVSLSEPVTPEDIENRQRLWLLLLILSLGLFLAEAVIARRIRLAKMVG